MKSLDIETIRNDDMIDSLPGIEVAIGNLKDEEKIEAKKAEAKRQQIEKMALSPLTGRICSFATCSEDEGNSGYKVIRDIGDSDERWLICDIFEEISLNKDGRKNHVVTWNGNGFDLPFIYKRAAILGVKIPASVMPLSYWTKRYSTHPHCDLMQVWSNWGSFDYAKLDTVAKSLIGDGKSQIDVSVFPDLIKTGRANEIGEYNLCDAIITMKLYKKLSDYLF